MEFLSAEPHAQEQPSRRKTHHPFLERLAARTRLDLLSSLAANPGCSMSRNYSSSDADSFPDWALETLHATSR